VNIPVTNVITKRQFEINGCLLFSLDKILDENIKPMLLGINAKHIIGISIEKWVYSGNIISTIGGKINTAKIVINVINAMPKIFIFFVCLPDESSDNVKRKIELGIIARNDNI